jgi:hypothetical protein
MKRINTMVPEFMPLIILPNFPTFPREGTPAERAAYLRELADYFQKMFGALLRWLTHDLFVILHRFFSLLVRTVGFSILIKILWDCGIAELFHKEISTGWAFMFIPWHVALAFGLCIAKLRSRHTSQYLPFPTVIHEEERVQHRSIGRL